MSDAEKEPLKPCPFCGSDQNLMETWTCCGNRDTGDFEEVIYCGCGAMGPPFNDPGGLRDTHAEARALWNARPAPNEPPRQGG